VIDGRGRLAAARSAFSPQNRPFVALCAATSISLVGNELTAIALPWLVLTALGTPLDTGIVGAGVLLPAVIGAFVGGAVIDRLGSRLSSIAADLASGLAVVAIPILAMTMGLSVLTVFVLAFLGALLDAPGAAARQVLVPDVADRAGIGPDRANAVYQAVQNISFMLGPVAGGLLIVAVGAINALWFDALSFVVSAAIVALAIPRPVSPPSREESADLLAGLKVIASDRLLGGMTFVAAIANFVGTPVFVVLLPALAVQSGESAEVLGLLIGAFAAGMVLGSIGYGMAGSRLPRRSVLVGGLIGTGIGIGVVALGPPIPIAVAALVVGGCMTGPINPIVFTVMQERIPPALRGRAIGAILGAVLVAAPIGMLVMGALTEARGPALGLAAAAMAFVVAGVIVAAWGAFDGMDRDRGVLTP
jgi:predicted MFS family arabinose efflux permease